MAPNSFRVIFISFAFECLLVCCHVYGASQLEKQTYLVSTAVFLLFHYMPFQTVERCTDAPTASHTDCSSVRMNVDHNLHDTKPELPAEAHSKKQTQE